MDSTALFLGVLWSSIGFGYFLYGKKQQKTVPLVCGILLIILPYLIDQPTALTCLGLLLAGLPYFLRHLDH